MRVCRGSCAVHVRTLARAPGALATRPQYSVVLVVSVKRRHVIRGSEISLIGLLLIPSTVFVIRH